MRVPFSVTTDTSVKHNARNYFDFGRNSDKVKLVLQIIMDKKRHGLQIPDRMKLRHYLHSAVLSGRWCGDQRPLCGPAAWDCQSVEFGFITTV